MKQKEKAQELFLKFRQIPPCSPYTGIDDGEAKQCALVAVDEILNAVNWHNMEADLNYWNGVKQEIINL
jgi:hypothetical protein